MKSNAIAVISFLNTLGAVVELGDKEMWAELGYEADFHLELGTGVSSEQNVIDFIGELTRQLAQMALIEVNPPKSIKDYKPFFTSSLEIFKALQKLADFEESSTGSDTSIRDLSEQLGFKLLKRVFPVPYAITDLFNLIEEEEKDSTPKQTSDGKFLRFAHRETRFNLENIGKAPTDTFKVVYFADEGSPELLIEKIKNLLFALRIPFAYGIKPVDEIGNLDEETRKLLRKNLSCWFTIGDDLLFGCSFVGLKKNEIGNDAPMVLVTPVAGLTDFEYRVGDWDFSFAISQSFPAFYFNDSEFKSVGDLGGNTFTTSFALTKTRGNDRGLAYLFGHPDGTRLELGEVGVQASVFLSEQANTERLKITLAVQKAKFVLDRGDGDGLLKKILPEKGLEFTFDFKLNYSNSRGVYFEGQAGTELVVPVGLKIGSAFTLPEIQLGFKFTEKHGLAIYASLSGETKLGPFFVNIGRTGVQLDFVPSQPGKVATLGFADVDLRFKPPSEIGVVVRAELIEGGGFLSFDFDSGNYFGVIYLSIKSKLQIKAIGIIQTRMPDGSEGFSFLLLITAEFPAIQLGLGFRLEGVGGIVGINRTINREALLTGMRDNTLDNILFPADPVKNAALIFRQSSAVFPAEQGSHTFGIMFLLTWGTKSLVQLKLGLVLKYQDPSIIALLGVLKIGVEKEVSGKKVTIFKLQVNFKADYEEGKYFAFDASLYKSTFLGFELVGDLCVRWKGSPDPYFLLSAGGFHPDFQPPALNLPKDLQRLKFILADSESVKINGYAYLAVTSNTLQFGGGFSAYINVWKLSIEGTLNFDAIFYRSGNPNFKVNANGSVKVSIWGFTIGGIKVKGEISGTTPWHFEGSVTFEIGWWDYTKSVDKTWGEETEELLESISLVNLLTEELSTKEAWQPVRRRLSKSVSIRPVQSAAQSTGALAHPDESLEVRQAVLPLKIAIDHYGHFSPGELRKFELQLATTSGTVTSGDTTDFFAPAEFFDMTQEERMSRKSYDNYNAGISAGFEKLAGGRFRLQPIDYEPKVIDDQYSSGPLTTPNVSPLPLDHFITQIRGNAIARSRPGRAARIVRKNFGLRQEKFALHQLQDLSDGAAELVMGNEAEVHAALSKLDRSTKEQFAVVPLWEIRP